MTRRVLIPVLAALAAAVVGLNRDAAAAPRAPTAKAPPNVVLIVADDMGWADNSVFRDRGLARYPTPNLERLANSGVKFDNAYVTASVCAPSRAGLLTGRYQNRFGFAHLPDLSKANPGSPEVAGKLGVDPHEITLADVLKQAGYATGAIGKWHLGKEDPFYPTQRGFDEFYGFLGGLSQYISSADPGVHLGGGGAPANSGHAVVRPASTALVEGPGRRPVDNFHTYLTEDLTAKGVDFIDRHGGKQPFFLYLAYNAVHAPFEVTDKYYQRFPQIRDENERIKAAMTSALDDGIGQLMDELDRRGLRENTLIVFLSDNGCALYLNAAACTCHPLRGGKLSQFEGGTRSPMIVSWPGRAPKGRTFSPPVSALDIFPTAVRAAGAALPADRRYDGVDLMPWLTGAKRGGPHDTLYWERDPYESILDRGWKLWRSKDGKVKALFDLAHDPNEATNLYGRRADKVAELSRKLDAWEARMPPEAFPGPELIKSNYCGMDVELPG